MKFSLEIDMDNDAFEDSYELVYCLKQVADSVLRANDGAVRDSNGNRVGVWSVEL